jgi:pimeloyl-ACP methyl ester carboxylesterase
VLFRSMPVTAGQYFHLYESANTGKKSSIVLIHGAGGTNLSWPTEIRRLVGYRVYAIDLPGHGKSGGCAQQSIPAYGQTLLTWLAACELPRAIFVGHSMGSAIALWLATHHPEYVAGLVLIGGGLRLPIPISILDLAANSTTIHQAMDELTTLSFSPNTPPSLVTLARERLRATRPSALYSDLVACSGFDEMGTTSNILTPTLVMVGADDCMTPLRSAQRLTHSIRNARLVTIPRTGHMVMLEDPATVVTHLRQFFATIP